MIRESENFPPEFSLSRIKKVEKISKLMTNAEERPCETCYYGIVKECQKN